MRRAEFTIEDPGLIQTFLEKAESGTLAMVTTDGEPYATEVNLVWFKGALWFHSGLAGTKMSILKQSPKVHISIVEASSFIPSYATDAENACSATQFFRSVHVKGTAEITQDMELKKVVLTALMHKMQPEGKFRAFGEGTNGLKSTGVVKILSREITAKFKFGQNLTPKKRTGLIQCLQQSTDPRAQSALGWVKKLQP